jgi:DNA-binding CsgD family transcriptional regulator
MNPSHFSSSMSIEAERILVDHGKSLPLLASGQNPEFAFYTHDLERRLTYLSDSSWQLLGIREVTWKFKLLREIFTDHPWNQVLQPPDCTLDPERIQSIQIEVLDDEGTPIKVHVRRRLILLREQPIGVVGIVNRIAEVESTESTESTEDFQLIRTRIATLTIRERKVVELVVRGEMNKSIAEALGIAIRTVEARRSKAMAKMGAKRLPELVRMWIVAGGTEKEA